MRKGIAEGRSGTIKLTRHSLEKLESKGYRFVLVKGLTPDHHYEHVEPHCLLLVPIKELPSDPAKKDIYAPIGSEILRQWASEKQDTLEILIANRSYH
ncbi:MAG: hypothetical protein JNK14_09255 [Chitinophagaceae bacterium]|nr:hypothetical protein [Chitinophagaceae bacterium]